MIGDGAGLLGWYIGFSIGVGGCFVYGIARGLAAAFTAANQTIRDAAADVNLPDPGRIEEWDPWSHPVLLQAEKAEQQ